MEFTALPGVVLRVFGGFPALAVFCTVFALAFDLMKRWKKCGNYPPGPRALPFLGNLLQVDLHNPHLSFTKLRKKYGDVMSLDFGWTNVVVLSGYKALKEALVKKSEDFADRPELPVYKTLFQQIGEAAEEVRRCDELGLWVDKRGGVERLQGPERGAGEEIRRFCGPTRAPSKQNALSADWRRYRVCKVW
ncbi:cytochrome P450 2D3-like [Amblyraja radiata]|uniref:cytochrome P450 2D3-like n=1 Tax=Amblyraja radiata TaxID=386614 RepID=UPI0014035F28|nr:cytochrome P450 2D3-like [Amblyraja radiata]